MKHDENSRNDSNETHLGMINRKPIGSSFAFVTPLVAKSSEFVFVHRNELPESDWEDLKPGQWIEFKMSESQKGICATNARMVDPSIEDRQRRLLKRYSQEPSMAGGCNPRSQRLDGLTGLEAKDMNKRGLMTDDQFYGNMSENGLQAVANSKRAKYIPGERERSVRNILQVIAEKEHGTHEA